MDISTVAEYQPYCIGMRNFIHKTIVTSIFIAVATIASAPFIVHGEERNTTTGFASTAGEILNPDKWFEVFKKSITFPITKDTEIKVPTPKEALEGASSTLRDINKDIQNEVGIDFAKFFGWFAKVLKIFFQIIVDLLEQVSNALKS